MLRPVSLLGAKRNQTEFGTVGSAVAAPEGTGPGIEVDWDRLATADFYWTYSGPYDTSGL